MLSFREMNIYWLSLCGSVFAESPPSDIRYPFQKNVIDYQKYPFIHLFKSSTQKNSCRFVPGNGMETDSILNYGNVYEEILDNNSTSTQKGSSLHQNILSCQQNLFTRQQNLLSCQQNLLSC